MSIIEDVWYALNDVPNLKRKLELLIEAQARIGLGEVQLLNPEKKLRKLNKLIEASKYQIEEIESSLHTSGKDSGKQMTAPCLSKSQ